MEHRGRSVTNVVAHPVDNHVIGVKVSSYPVILPKIEDGPVEPPEIPRCFDRHIIRTGEQVIVVEVMARVKVYPRTVPYSDVLETARSELDVALQEGENYDEGLNALADRIAWRLQKQGVKVQ